MTLSTTPRILGIDYGTKRVGVAVADPLRMFAQPLGAFSPEGAEQFLLRFHRDEGIELAVVGWPLTIEGEEAEATALVQRFVDRMQRLLPEVPVVKWDERSTSRAAEEAIRSAGARRKARRDKGRIDAAAAAVILQEYLDDLKAGA